MIEKDFYKLLNNANFGYDCRNNLDNCKFEPICDETDEISYIKKYCKPRFEKDISQFVNSELVEAEIEKSFNNEMQKIPASDPFRAAKIQYLNDKRKSDKEAALHHRQKEKKSQKKRTIKSYESRLEEANKDKKIKSIIDFDTQNSHSIKSISIKKNTTIKVTTRFTKGKMLMFSKTSLKNFVYDIIGVFCFPDEDVLELYAQNYIIKCFIYLLYTDTDSCFIKFLFLRDIKSHITENATRELIFKIIMQSKIGPRIDTSDIFFEQFDCRNPSLNIQVGLYEVESIDNPNVVTVALNPKEYFEVFRNKNFNKKHEGVKKATEAIDFESHASRIMDLREYDSIDKKPKQLIQKRFQTKNSHMKLVSGKKLQFVSLNDKRYYFSDGISSLLFGHFLLNEVREKKN